MKFSLNRRVVQPAMRSLFKRAATPSRHCQARSFTPILICCCTTWATRLPTIARTSKPTGASGKRPRCEAVASRKPSMAFGLDSCTTEGQKPFSKPLCFTVVKLNGRARKCAGYPEPTERHCSPFCDRCRTPHRRDENRLDNAPSAPATPCSLCD